MDYILQQIEILNNYQILIYPFVFFGILAIISLFADKFNVIKFISLILLPAIYVLILQNINGNYEIVFPFFSKQLFLKSFDYSILSTFVLGFILINAYYFLEKTTRLYLFSYNILIGSLLCLFLVKDLISFFIFLEIFTLCLFLLILHSNKKAALTYFVVSTFAGVLFFGAVAALNIETSNITIRSLDLNYSLAQILIVCSVLVFLGFIGFSYYLSNAIEKSSNKTASIIILGKSKAMLILLMTLFPYSNLFINLGIATLAYFVILGLFEGNYKKSVAFLYLAQSAYYLATFSFYEDKSILLQHFVLSFFLLIPLLFISSRSTLSVLNKILMSLVFLCFILSASPVNNTHKIASFLLNLLAVRIWLNLMFFDKEKEFSSVSLKASLGIILALVGFFYYSKKIEFLNEVEFKLIGTIALVGISFILHKFNKINLKELELTFANLITQITSYAQTKYAYIALNLENKKLNTINFVHSHAYKYFAKSGKLENSTKLSNTISIVAILLVILFILFLI